MLSAVVCVTAMIQTPAPTAGVLSDPPRPTTQTADQLLERFGELVDRKINEAIYKVGGVAGVVLAVVYWLLRRAVVANLSGPQRDALEALLRRTATLVDALSTDSRDPPSRSSSTP